MAYGNPGDAERAKPIDSMAPAERSILERESVPSNDLGQSRVEVNEKRVGQMTEAGGLESLDSVKWSSWGPSGSISSNQENCETIGDHKPGDCAYDIQNGKGSMAGWDMATDGSRKVLPWEK